MAAVQGWAADRTWPNATVACIQRLCAAHGADAARAAQQDTMSIP